ncbi:MAG: glycosyltransferase family A protein [Solirubrobacterales bacterium]
MSDHRLLIITPVRNEAEHIQRVASGLLAQVRKPDLWLVVNDGSDDDTLEVAERLSLEIDFMRVVSTPTDFTRASADRLAVAAAPRAFNYGLHTIDPRQLSLFTHIGKLDGDVELLSGYFAAVLAEFDRDPRLGIAGGVILERHHGEWQETPSAREHVRGALKLYSRDCFAAIGGVDERLGWDGIDEVTARMRGYETRSLNQARALHHRHTGSADGRLRGHVRWGEAHWILHHGPAWTLMRAGKVATIRPQVVSGAAYIYGYARAAVRGVERVDTDGYKQFVRAEQRRRIRARLGRDVASPRATAPVGG